MRWICVILLNMICVALAAQRVSLSLHDAPLSEALRQIDQGQQERRIVFVFNEMERFRVTKQIRDMEPLEAVREVCSSLPIRIKRRGKNVFVEAMAPLPRSVQHPVASHPRQDSVRVLDEVTVVRKRIRYNAQGYTAQLHAEGLQAAEALTYLPNVMREGDNLYVHGLRVSEIFLDGMPIGGLEELEHLQGDMIEEVRIDYQPCVIYIALRQPAEGGFYGSVHGELIGQGEHNDYGSAGAVWYSRHKGLSLYNRLQVDTKNYTEEFTNIYAQPQAINVYTGETESSNRLVTNRFSINREFNRHHTLGASLYLAYNGGKASSEMHRIERNYYFEGENQHSDTELTLKYCYTYGYRNSTIDVLLDVFDRRTQTENLSLYGFGVGTELGESPSITLWRGMVESRQVLSERIQMLSRLDLRSHSSLYDADKYNSNFLGAPTIQGILLQRGTMVNGSIEVLASWQRLQFSVGLWAKLNHTEAVEVHKTWSQHCLSPHLRVEFPLDVEGQNQLALSWQRRLDDIPYAAQSPAMRWSDPFNFSMGNVELQAPITSTLMLNASLWRGRLNLTSACSKVEKEIYWQTSIAQGQTDVFYTQPVNVDQLRLWSLQGELNLHPASWWQLKAAAQLTWRMEDATVGDEHYAEHHLQQRYTMDHNFHFGHGWMASLHGEYEPRHSLYERTYHATWHLGGEVQKGWLDNRLQTSLLFVALGRNRHLDRRIDGSYICYQYRTPLQQLGLRVTWNFRGGHKVKVGTVEGGLRYEENRETL